MARARAREEDLRRLLGVRELVMRGAHFEPHRLRYTPRRVLYREHGVKVERVPWAVHGSHFTYEFEQMTAWLAQRMDRTASCRLMGINWRTVGTIIQRVVQAQLDPARLEELYVIGVDELSFRRHHEYVTVVVDHLKKRVVSGRGQGGEDAADVLRRVGRGALKGAHREGSLDLPACAAGDCR